MYTDGNHHARCIKFRHSLRCTDVLVIFVFKTNSTFQRLQVPDAMGKYDEVFMDKAK